MIKSTQSHREEAESIAIQGLAYIATDPDLLSRFLALTGIGPADIRAASKDPGFLAGVLEYIMQDEALLIAFSKQIAADPKIVTKAQSMLAGPAWEREIP